MKVLKGTIKFEIEDIDDTDESSIAEAILDRLQLMTESDLEDGLKYKIIDLNEDEEPVDEED